MSSDTRVDDELDEFDQDDLSNYIDALPEPECAYPVIVTVHTEHVVWLEAASLKGALDDLKNDPAWYESLGAHNETVASVWEEMRSPGGDYHHGGLDWDMVYRAGDGQYLGVYCNAHVESWKSVQWAEKRAEEQRVCKAAGHPEVKEFATKPYCNNCGYLSIADLIADLRAVNGA
jgi:hypothetical protein